MDAYMQDLERQKSIFRETRVNQKLLIARKNAF